MAKNIILLSDGTGNSSASLWRTNVWRVLESLDLTDSSQVAIYDHGSSCGSSLRLIRNAFTAGLNTLSGEPPMPSAVSPSHQGAMVPAGELLKRSS